MKIKNFRGDLTDISAEKALICTGCRFYAGERGLRAHQQIKHSESYEIAKAVVSDAKLQVVPYTMSAWAPAAPGGPPPGPRACVSKSILHPAFVAARDGDLPLLKEIVAAGAIPYRHVHTSFLN